MFEYEDLNEEEKSTLRDYLHVGRMSRYYLEDNNIVLMSEEELFDYIYLDEIKKTKDAINLIRRVIASEVSEGDTNKSFREIILERNQNVKKISDRVYLYKE